MRGCSRSDRLRLSPLTLSRFSSRVTPALLVPLGLLAPLARTVLGDRQARKAIPDLLVRQVRKVSLGLLARRERRDLPVRQGRRVLVAYRALRDRKDRQEPASRATAAP